MDILALIKATQPRTQNQMRTPTPTALAAAASVVRRSNATSDPRRGCQRSVASARSLLVGLLALVLALLAVMVAMTVLIADGNGRNSVTSASVSVPPASSGLDSASVGLDTMDSASVSAQFRTPDTHDQMLPENKNSATIVTTTLRTSSDSESLDILDIIGNPKADNEERRAAARYFMHN